MKFIFFMLAGVCLADDATPKQSSLSAIQQAVYEKTSAQMDMLLLKYKIAEYRKEADPVVAEQNATISEACKALGVPADKIQSECRFDPKWVDPATKKEGGRVFWVVPTPPAKPDKEK